ncbi:flagellar hook-length control protein FliK [Caulobacter sp. 602-1]|nr:flagellar hook-length control protein FliK [Caulobacter sp. 602-1]
MAAQAKAADAVAVETAQAVTAVAADKGQTTTDAKGSDQAAATIVSVEAPVAVAAAAAVDTNAMAVQAPAAQAQAASAAAPAAAAAPVRGSPETVAALSAEILKRADKATRFDVTLTPDNLGKVDVRIEIGRDGAMTASMRFDTLHAAQELRGKAGELRQALNDAGFNVADNGLSFDVSSQNNGQNSNPFLAFQDFGDQGRRAFSGRAFQASLTGEEDIAIAPADLLPGLKTVADSGLDIRI